MTATAAPPSPVRVLRSLGLLTLAESRRLTREPMFLIGTVGFPVLFYSLFGLPRGGVGPEVSRAALLNLAAFSLVSLSLFSFGANVAAERSGGWLRLMRASPMPLWAYLSAKLLAAWLYGALAVTLLMLYAGAVGGVWLGSPGVYGLALLKLLLGASPLVALGLAIGFLAPPAAAGPLANVFSLLLVFLGGLALPLPMLPPALARWAPLLPTFHLGAVAGSVLSPVPGEAGHWLVILATTLLLGALALWGLRRDESRER